MNANRESFGSSLIPSYDFSKARVIVSISCDFLGSWHSAITATSQYASTRNLDNGKKEMSRHFQFESNLSLTGANADYRTPVKPSQEGLVAAQLYNIIAGASLPAGNAIPGVEQAAKELLAAKGQSIVVAGSNDKNVQVLVNAINAQLGNYGQTINNDRPVNYRKGDDAAMASFVSDLEGGKTKGVIFYNCNPVYDHPEGSRIAASLKNSSVSVSTSGTENETATACAYVAPDHHYLESWNDAEPVKGSFSLSQPVITPLFLTRHAQESLLTWAGETGVVYFNVVKTNWKNWFFQSSGALDFQMFWDKCLYDGVYEPSVPAAGSAASFAGDVAAAAAAVNAVTADKGLEIAVYQSYAVGDGSQANNPLLQELPDPITKVVWDHPLTISVKDAAQLGFTNDGESNTQLAELSVGGFKVNVPVLIQPGQAQGSIGISLGYGRTKVGRVAEGLGVNVYPLLRMSNGSLSNSVSAGVKLVNTGTSFQLAQTQTHNTAMGRDSVIQESVLSKFVKDPKAGRYDPLISKWDEKVAPGTLSLWKGHDYKDHHWAMAIDLNSCTGCGACIVACNVENNVALVGKDEVIRRREMHWLRIDRYYSSDADVEDLRGLEVASENPEVVFQPMLCQHCNNAPCETVCPVAATTHSSEGLNQMTYNRCIGTRYCANNCPYKVRRFNWFKYHDNQKFFEANPAMNTDLGRMVLNPDVTVRSRGVMEKCSFCVQRIQSAKLTAKKEKRKMQDGDVITACQASCTSGAITFGDLNDSNSKVTRLLQAQPDPDRPYGIDKKIGNPRAYTVLEEIGVKPNVFYLTKIRNKEEAKA
ncbi:MAG: 4Fe-4S dicluster domain-containing protein [Bacteroidota bacterium]